MKWRIWWASLPTPEKETLVVTAVMSGYLDEGKKLKNLTASDKRFLYEMYGDK